MKERYERPVISKLKMGTVNKFGYSSRCQGRVRTEIDGIEIETLVKKYGSPLFVFSEKTAKKKYQEMSNAFSSRYPRVVFGWSYKTNYLSSICSLFHKQGAIAEVVSEMEYEKARKLGVAGCDIIFNGPHKPMRILERAVSEGAMIHIDHLEELIDLEEIADKIGKKILVGLRLNMETGISPHWSRFGLNIDSGEALNFIQRIKEGGKLILNGLHCHIGTFILDPNAYAVAIEKMVTLAYDVEDKFNFKIDYLDIGGGIPSMIKLKGTYFPPEIAVPSIDAYAEKIVDALYKNLRSNDFPQLILENGRALIDEAGYLVTTIVATKNALDGRKLYVIDAGLNLLFTSFWYKYRIEIDRDVQGMEERSMIYGPLCMNIDLIEDDVMLPSLQRGSRFILSPVGAYNVTQWMQFIAYRPNIILIDEQGNEKIIREAEELSDIESRERFCQNKF